MKKLVAIALVLALASMANAGIGFVAVGGNTVNPGQVVTIQLVSTVDQMAGGFSFGILSDNGANGSVSGLTYATGAAGTQTFTVVSGGEVLNTAAGVGATSGAGTSALIYALTLQANALINPGVLASFSYTVPATAHGQINLGVLAAGAIYMYSDGDSYAADASYANMKVGGAPTDVAIDGVTLNVVPEPMTLGLLSLGGLFLRRRLA
jgi:hypothetical protein